MHDKLWLSCLNVIFKLRLRNILFGFGTWIRFSPLVRARCTCLYMTTRWQHVYTAFPSKSTGRRRSALSAASDGWPTWRLRGTLLQSPPAKSPKCQTQQDQTASSVSDRLESQCCHVTWILSCKTRLCLYGLRHWLDRRLLPNKKNTSWIFNSRCVCWSEGPYTFPLALTKN